LRSQEIYVLYTISNLHTEDTEWHLHLGAVAATAVEAATVVAFAEARAVGQERLAVEEVRISRSVRTWKFVLKHFNKAVSATEVDAEAVEAHREAVEPQEVVELPEAVAAAQRVGLGPSS